jgi:hypothetical protein
MPAPVESTYCSDPNACFTVSSIGEDSAGIQGYFVNEFDAHRVAAYYKKQGHQQVTVDPYDPTATERTGIHELVMQFMLHG